MTARERAGVAGRWRAAAVPLALAAIAGAWLVASRRYDADARALPVLVASATLVLVVLEVLVQAKTRLGRKLETLLEARDPLQAPARAPLGTALVHALLWPGVLAGATLLLGLLPGTALYIALSLRLAGGKPWLRSVLVALGVTALAWLLFEWAMAYELYRGLVWERFVG